MEKFENPAKIKKSFEIKYQNDDDDEIFIVHDEEEDDQDCLFVSDPKSLLSQSEQIKTETLNPFVDNLANIDNLANSEVLPEISNKLDVLINDNYIN
jgi:hypothetical protein